MIEQQFSPTVALAQCVAELDKVYDSIKHALVYSSLPDELKNIGLVYSETKGVVYVDLHGYSQLMRYDHVWRKDGGTAVQLYGRVRFFTLTPNGDEAGEVFAAFFDKLGNLRCGRDGHFDTNALSIEERPAFVRKLSLALANAIHAMMDAIEGPPV